MTQHVGCMPCHHHPPGLVFPFYPLFSHSLNPPIHHSDWYGCWGTWVLLQWGGGGMMHEIVELDKLALAWPTYGHWPGRLTAAVGGHAVVVVVRATAGRATRTSGRAWTSRGSEGLVYYEIIDYIINAPSRGSEEERMGIPCWWRYI